MEQEELVITGEEFKSWTEHEITKSVVKRVLSIRERLKDHLAAGGTLEGKPSTAMIVGQIQGLTELFNLFQEVKENEEDEV